MAETDSFSPIQTSEPTIKTGDPFYSESNLERLRKIAAEIDSGKSVLREHQLIEG